MITWFIYEFCSDVAATRRFYADLVGLDPVWNEEESIAFIHGSVQVSFSAGQRAQPAEGWTLQPGWGHGQVPLEHPPVKNRSWSIALRPGEFRSAVDRLTAAGVPSLSPEPMWIGYWSYVVRDPDGTTVELSDPVTGES